MVVLFIYNFYICVIPLHFVLLEKWGRWWCHPWFQLSFNFTVLSSGISLSDVISYTQMVSDQVLIHLPSCFWFQPASQSFNEHIAAWWQHQGSKSVLVQVTACCLMATSLNLIECWFIINSSLPGPIILVFLWGHKRKKIKRFVMQHICCTRGIGAVFIIHINIYMPVWAN